jgi:hypothetical protein
MLFRFPVKRIKDTGWFLSDTDTLKYGTVVKINIAIAEDTCTTYYVMDLGDDKHVVVPETSLLDNDVLIPSPKFHIGDEVEYTYQVKDKPNAQATGLIERIEVNLHADGAIENVYYMDGDNFFTLESEIIGFTEQPIINIIDATNEREMYV